MERVFTATSRNKSVKEVIFGRDGDFGWKLDVIGHDPDWEAPYGDAWEESLDAIIPYLKRYIDEHSIWKDMRTGEIVNLWTVISEHSHYAGIDEDPL